jgi:16S rRNA (uracil1498-N3)-methyltransferase
MRITRIYQDQALSVLATICLQADAVHHLRDVLRAKVGDELVVFNGQGGEYSASVTAVDRRECRVKLEQFDPIDRQSPAEIHLLQALVGNEKMDLIIQKAVELGVRSITPCLTTRCNTKIPPQRLLKRYQHWQKVIIYACEQCGLNRLPQLHQLQPFKTALQAYQDVILCHPGAAQPLTELQIPSQSITIAIGPEGGFCPEEVKAPRIRLARLSPRVLRTETAAITALVMLQNQIGDL